MNREQIAVRLNSRQILTVVLGDLTQEHVDVIVNAANRYLSHAGGVAGAILRCGGYQIQRESTAWVTKHGPVATGSAVITSGGALIARHVIHVVGPAWTHGYTEPDMLRKGVHRALALADEYSLTTISLPAISSGIFGFPKPLAVEVIWDSAVSYLRDHPSGLREVRFCNSDRETTELFCQYANRYAEHYTLASTIAV